MKYKKKVEIPTGIVTFICTSLQGTVKVEINDHLKGKYMQFPETLKPIENGEARN